MIVIGRTLGGFVLGWLVVRVLGLLARLGLARGLEAQRISRCNFVRNATLGAVVLILAQFGVLQIVRKAPGPAETDPAETMATSGQASDKTWERSAARTSGGGG